MQTRNNFFKFETNRDVNIPEYPPRTTIVFANTQFPELNGTFEAIYSAKDFKGVDGKSWFYGFSIVQEVDVRWILDNDDDVFKCRVWTKNSVLLTMPAGSYTFQKDRDHMQADVDQAVLDAVDDDNHDYVLHAPTRKMKNILIVFPDFVELSAKVIHEHEDTDDETDILLKTFVNKYTHKEFQGHDLVKHFIYWNVARLDIAHYKKGKVDLTKRNRAKAALFGPASPTLRQSFPASISIPDVSIHDATF